jgi:hypothetical protein
MPQNLSAQRYEHLEKLVKDTEEMKFPRLLITVNGWHGIYSLLTGQRI